MSSQAVGLNEVGGVTKGANQTLDVQSGNAQNARNTQTLADTLGGRNYGPAARAQHAAMTGQASALGAQVLHTADRANRNVQGERHAVQGHDEATQTYAPAASQADTTVTSLNRSI